MKRYLPEALFFASAAFVLVVLRLDAFGDISEFLVFGLLLLLGPLHGAIPATLIISVIALKFKRRGAAVVAPILGAALVICADVLIFTVDILRAVPRTPEFYWGALAMVPIVAITVFIASRIIADRKAVLAYACGALLLTACYFASPWASDLALVLMRGPSLQVEFSKSHKAFTTYDYTYGLLDEGQEDVLVYDPTDTTSNRVLTRFTQSDHCNLNASHIVSSYYAIHYVIDSKCY